MKLNLATSMPKFARALRSRPFALLWLGQTISVLGDGAFFVALTWQVLLTTNSATAMGIVEGAQTLPGLVFLLLGGVATDRLPRRLLLLCSDAGRGFVVLLLAVLTWFHLVQFWHFIALALLFGTVDGFFWPASQAILPQLVTTDDLPSANGLIASGQRLSLIAGPLLGMGLVLLVRALSIMRLNPSLFASLAMLVYGLSMGVSNLLSATLIQEHVPEDKLGRVNSINLFCSLGLTPVGLALGGFLTDTLGPSLVFIACGLVNVLLATIAIATRDIRLLD